MKTLDQKSVENLFESCTLLSNHRRKPKKKKKKKKERKSWHHKHLITYHSLSDIPPTFIREHNHKLKQ